MEAIKWIGFIAIIVAHSIYVTKRTWLRGEVARNDSYDPPSDQQLKWDIRHIREDMSMLVINNFAIFVVLLAILFFKN
jgi:hypothetical protein